MKLGSYFLALLVSTLSLPSYAHVSCEGEVKEILPHIKTGAVAIQLTDGTKITGREGDPGLDRNMSIALAALMANQKVRILLSDGQSCGVNSHENWAYIVAFKQ